MDTCVFSPDPKQTTTWMVVDRDWGRREIGDQLDPIPFTVPLSSDPHHQYRRSTTPSMERAARALEAAVHSANAVDSILDATLVRNNELRVAWLNSRFTNDDDTKEATFRTQELLIASLEKEVERLRADLRRRDAVIAQQAAEIERLSRNEEQK